MIRFLSHQNLFNLETKISVILHTNFFNKWQEICRRGVSCLIVTLISLRSGNKYAKKSSMFDHMIEGFCRQEKCRKLYQSLDITCQKILPKYKSVIDFCWYLMGVNF